MGSTYLNTITDSWSIYSYNITTTSTTTTTTTTSTTTTSRDDSSVFFPSHTSAGAFLYALYREGFITKDARIIPEAFKNIPFPSLFLSQLQALSNFVRNQKIHVSVESNPYHQPSPSPVIAEGDVLLDHLNVYLSLFAKFKFNFTLNPLLIGGYLRHLLLLSLESAVSC